MLNPSSGRRIGLGGAQPHAAILDKYAAVSIIACIFALIVDPLFTIYFNPPPYTIDTIMVPRLDTRIFSPALATLPIFLALRNRFRLSALSWPPHIIILGIYLVLAGASVLWSFKPEFSLIRFLQLVMVVTSIVLPALLANRSVDLMRAL